MTNRIPALAAAVLLLAGCGSTSGGTATTRFPAASSGPACDRTGPEVLADAVQALEQAGAVHVVSTVDTPGSPPFDVHLQEGGAAGTVRTSDEVDTPFRVVDGEAYLLLHPDAWADLGATEEEAEPLRGRWLRVPADELGDGGPFPVSVADVTAMHFPHVDDVLDDVRHATLDGEDVLVVTSEHGRSVTVQAAPPGRPLRVDVPAERAPDGLGHDGGTVTFSRFGEQRTIAPPADPVDASEVGLGPPASG